MRSVTARAPRVSQCSSTLVGALHWTGVVGPVSVRMRGPPSADTEVVVPGFEVGFTVGGAERVVATEVVEVVALDVVVEERDGPFESSLLLHAVGSTSAAVIAIEASRGRRTQRS